MQSDPHVQAVIGTVARVGSIPVDRLGDRLDADLAIQLGFDSLQILEIWATLESEFGLWPGALGVAQPATLRMIADEIAKPQNREGLNQTEIEALIPHRRPILMLDRVAKLEPGQRGVGIMELPEGDARFAGHFPDQPILPGVLIVEACAQLVAVVCQSGRAAELRPTDAPAIEYLASIERFKFLSPVTPGTALVLEARIDRRAGGLLQARVSARVRERLAAEGMLIVTARS